MGFETSYGIMWYFNIEKEKWKTKWMQHYVQKICIFFTFNCTVYNITRYIMPTFTKSEKKVCNKNNNFTQIL